MRPILEEIPSSPHGLWAGIFELSFFTDEVAVGRFLLRRVWCRPPWNAVPPHKHGAARPFAKHVGPACRRVLIAVAPSRAAAWLACSLLEPTRASQLQKEHTP
jgi:hypothetical protein